MMPGKPYHKNPRQITRKKLAELGDSLERLGDLGGIVHNLETDEIIGGNQRNRVFDGGEVEIIKQWEEPDEQGTVGYGFIIWQGKRYAYRQVRWGPATEEEANIRANVGGGSWDWDILADQWEPEALLNWGFDEGLLKDWQQDSFGLGEMLASEDGSIPLGTMQRREQGYNASSRDIDPIKLGHRIEAIWQANNDLAIDFFSGEGGLAFWYKRRFKRVVTIDKVFDHVDYKMTVNSFINNHLQEFIDDFDYVDFDDEGTPAREITLFFHTISGNRNRPFYLALTDGNGLNLKIHNRFDFSLYRLGDELRKGTTEDYVIFEDTVAEFVIWRAKEAGFTPTMLSNYRGREGNVVFQTWFIDV